MTNKRRFKQLFKQNLLLWLIRTVFTVNSGVVIHYLRTERNDFDHEDVETANIWQTMAHSRNITVIHLLGPILFVQSGHGNFCEHPDREEREWFYRPWNNENDCGFNFIEFNRTKYRNFWQKGKEIQTLALSFQAFRNPRLWDWLLKSGNCNLLRKESFSLSSLKPQKSRWRLVTWSRK